MTRDGGDSNQSPPTEQGERLCEHLARRKYLRGEIEADGSILIYISDLALS